MNQKLYRVHHDHERNSDYDDDPQPGPLPAEPFRLHWWHAVTFALGFAGWVAIFWACARDVRW